MSPRALPLTFAGLEREPYDLRDRWLQGDEEARLLKRADQFTHDMITGMLDTGLRADSLRKLTGMSSRTPTS